MRPGKYNWPAFKVGDVRVVENGDPLSIKAAASRFGRRYGCKFKTGKLSGGVRIERVA